MRWFLLSLVLAFACGDDVAPADGGRPRDAASDSEVDGATEDGATPDVSDAGMDAPIDAPVDSAAIPCDEPDLGEEAEWERPTITALTLASGNAGHSTQGPVVQVGQTFELPGKFAYGLISKDLQGEYVRALLRTSRTDCTWTELGPALTDDDGRAWIEAPAIAEPGLYEYRLVVAGDLTTAQGVVAVIDEGADIVVFDIDGTLTTDDGEVFEEVLLGGTAEVMEGGRDVVAFYADRGVQPVYITGRPYLLQERTREWLVEMNMPLGPLHTTDSVLSTLPGSRTEDYKRDYLQTLVDDGLTFRAAYGNADSDICAYARVGIPPSDTYIIGDLAGTACEGFDATNAVESYPAHLEELRAR